MAESKARKLEILSHKISKLEKMIETIKKMNFDSKKISKLEAELLRYKEWKEQIEYED